MVYLLTFARLLVGGLFAVSTATKLTAGGRRSFRRGVSGLGGIAAAWANPVAALVTGLECLVTGLTASTRTAPVGLALAAALLAGFAVVLVRAVRTASTESCHCFGGSGPAVAPRHVVRTATLGVLAAAGAVLAVPGWADRLGPAVPAGTALVAVAAMVTGVLLVRMDDVAAVFRPVAPGPHSRGHASAVPTNVHPPPTFAANRAHRRPV